MHKPALKIKSFGFEPEPQIRRCDSPGCHAAGDYRAPKSRQALSDYHWFCLDHVRAYNKSWNYFKGMSPGEVEAYNRHAQSWERPSWHWGTNSSWRDMQSSAEDRLRHAAETVRQGHSWQKKASNGPYSAYRQSRETELPQDVREALAVLDLVPPVTLPEIRQNYKKLAKLHHPDRLGSRATAEDEQRMREINHAWTLLKAEYKALKG